MSTVAGSNGNGHSKTKKARAVEVAIAYQEQNGRLPNRDQLAVLADCQPSTARDALALTRKG
jgi:hypothetical protein